MNKCYFGRYIHRKSALHSLNPLTKLIALVVLIGIFAVPDGNQFHILLGLCTVIFLVIASKVTLKEFYPSLRSFRFLIVFTFIVQAFFNGAGEFILRPSSDMIINAFLSALRFTIIIGLSAIFTITTPPLDIARSIYVFISPFRLLGFKTANAAVSLIISIRFIPLLIEEAEKIITAQKLRGLWPSANSGLKEKIRFFTRSESFIIPLFMRVMRYGEEISAALFYRPSLSKAMALPPVKKRDFLFILFTIIIAAFVYVL